MVRVIPIDQALNDYEKIMAVPAQFIEEESAIYFETPSIDDPKVCFFSIAMDGRQFTHYNDDNSPRFVYYGKMIMTPLKQCRLIS